VSKPASRGRMLLFKVDPANTCDRLTADRKSRFTPDCGSTVHYQLAQSPNVIAIPLGAFADPAFPAPEFSVYEGSTSGWNSWGQIERAD